MGKTHLTYKVNGKATGAAYCGNNNRNYKYGLTLAGSPKEFRESDNRCQHCERIYMEIRNRQRKSKGLSAVTTPFEGQQANT